MRHIYERLRKRKILLSEVVDCLEFPDQIVLGDKGRLVYQKVFVFNEKKMLLRVIAERDNESVKAITAYKTSQLKKYWKKEKENES